MQHEIAVEISNDLIYLRRVIKDDLGCYYRWYRDPKIQEHMANPYWDPKCSEDDYRILFLHRHLFRIGSSTTFTICLSESHKPIGLVNFFDIDRKRGCCELGVVVGEKELWGKGIGTSAIGLISEYLFDKKNLSTISCDIVRDNVKSIKLFEKCRFVFQKKIVERGIEFVRYELRNQSKVENL